MMNFRESLVLRADALNLISDTPAARALALDLVTRTDLVRLKVLARLHARGLPPDLDWTDLLQEAFTRVLNGSRRKPHDVPMVAFLSGVMRSIKAEHWRRVRREARQSPKLRANFDAAGLDAGEVRDPMADPERTLIAMQELKAIDQLFCDHVQARHVIAGLLDGQSPEEICASHGMTRKNYESTRKRMRRVLVRESLRSPQP
jgi:DNA-directed RNA polymerase specialized sigma24 family protein